MLTEQTQQTKPNPEVAATAKRRRFTAGEKQRLLREYEATPKGERGAFLRRNGIYSSYIDKWRSLATAGERKALEEKKRGRKVEPKPPPELQQLRLENERLKARLSQAEKVIEVQKKISEILGITLDQPDGPKNGNC